MNTGNGVPLWRRATQAVEDRPFQGDAIGDRERFATKLTSCLAGFPDGAVLAVDGEWGSGKTWLAERWRAQLVLQGYRSVYIDAFKFDYVEDPFLVIAGELLAAMRVRSGGEITGRAAAVLQRARKVGRSLLPAAGKLAVKAVVRAATLGAIDSDDVVKAVEQVGDDVADGVEKLIDERLEHFENERQTVEGFRTALSDLAAEEPHPFVILVDELDRCRPDFAVKTLERIKHFFDVPNLCFVLLLNRRQLEAAIRGVYGEGVDARSYLSKFVQLSVSMPVKVRQSPYTRQDAAAVCRACFERIGYNLDRVPELRKFAEIMGRTAVIFDMPLRSMERAVTLFVLSNFWNDYYMLHAWAIALKLNRPDAFRRLTTSPLDGHAQCEAIARELDTVEEAGAPAKVATVLHMVARGQSVDHLNGLQQVVGSAGVAAPSQMPPMFAEMVKALDLVA